MTRIAFTIGVGLRGPIAPGIYEVGTKRVQVDYPETLSFGPVGTIELPKSLSTVFTVSWEDRSGTVANGLRSQGYERLLPILVALEAISQLFLAFKLARIGHSDAFGIRTVGKGDTLFYFPKIDGVPTGDLNVGIKRYEGNNAWRSGADSADPHGTTALALPHMGGETLPIARRYVRCFELLEHGFYSEAFIVAFSILDDFVQQSLDALLLKNGISLEAERTYLMRGIKENRLKIYVGPLLKLTFGRDLESMWSGGPSALTWLNTTRNRIAHQALIVDYASAAKAIFACLKILVTFNENGAAAVEIPVELFRHAKITAAWTSSPPDWVPKGDLAESMDFMS